MNKTINIFEKGQSLVELVVALFVMALIVVAIVGLSTRNVRNTASSRNGSLARRYAEEGIEWIRKRRDEGWQSLWENGEEDNFKVFCFNSFPQADADWTDGSCSDSISGTIFSRELRLKKDGKNALDAQMVVIWNDSQGPHEVKLETKLYNLE